MRKLNVLKKTEQTEKNRWIKAEIWCLIICFFALLAGLLPYLFVRTSSTHISNFFDIFIHIEKIGLDKNGLLYKFLTSWFSDFCWAFAMPFFLVAVTKGRLSKWFYILGVPFVGSILELFQFLGVMDGVGDIIDAVIYFLASFLGYIIIERGVLNGK